MTGDKRRIKRISVELPVTVYLFDNREGCRTGDPLTGHIKNFSPVGAALTVASIRLSGRHLFYTCNDNPDMALDLEFDLEEARGGRIAVQATPVWFDLDRDAEEKQFVVGLKFLASAKSPEIKSLSRSACRDEKRLFSLWKRLF